MNAFFQNHSWAITAIGAAIGLLIAVFALNVYLMINEVSNIGNSGIILFLLVGLEFHPYDPDPIHDTTREVLDDW